MLWNRECHNALANNRVFRMSYIVRSAIAHMKSQWQKGTFL